MLEEDCGLGTLRFTAICPLGQRFCLEAGLITIIPHALMNPEL
jgi:hypothetical protein